MAGDFFHAGWVLKRALQLQPLRKSSIIIHLYCKTTWFFTSKYYTILTVWGMPTNSISRWNYAGCCRAAVTFSLQWGSYDWLDLLDLVRRGRCRLCTQPAHSVCVSPSAFCIVYVVRRRLCGDCNCVATAIQLLCDFPFDEWESHGGRINRSRVAVVTTAMVFFRTRTPHFRSILQRNYACLPGSGCTRLLFFPGCVIIAAVFPGTEDSAVFIVIWHSRLTAETPVLFLFFSLLSAPATVFCDKVTLISTFYNNNIGGPTT